MMLQRRVRDVLNDKSEKHILTAHPNDSVFEALKKMAIHNVGSLLVIDGEQIIGIVTERDYARKVVLADRTSRNTRLREIMDSRILYVIPEDTVEGCLSLMTEKRVRHLPVLEGSRLVGLISIGDVVKTVVADKEFTIDQLVRHITGAYTSSPETPRAMIVERTVDSQAVYTAG